ncbi:MAG: tetratricopeptide repeat protein [Candidatus Yanofskybacteria bacterium]|nr:tetratricopeptide repeat protein [Candidatus Yanofskybacteria bacterium]
MKKKLLFGLMGIAVLLIAGVAYLSWPKGDFVLQKDSGLSADIRGVIETRKKQAADVIDKFTKSTTGEEKFNWYLALASAETQLGNYKEARDAFKKALSSDPNSSFTAGANFDYAKLLISMEDYKGARKALEKSLKLQPTNGTYWETYIHLQLDHFGVSDKKVRELYQDAVKKSNSDPVIMSNYAAYLEQAGDRQAALDQWKALLTKYPANQQAPKEIERLQKLL